MKAFAVLVAVMMTVLSCVVATAVTFLAILPTSTLLAFCMIPVGVVVTYFVGILAIGKAYDCLN
jgi:hypothetical protein